MVVEFEKWHGCRNDFLVIWSTHNEANYLLGTLQRQASVFCARNGIGVGADGILVLLTESRVDLNPSELVIINADGSLASNCGNGLRCAALSVYKKISLYGNVSDEPEFIELKVKDKTFICHFEKETSQEFPNVTVEMGSIILNQDNEWYEKAVVEVTRVFSNAGLGIDQDQVAVGDLGNQHIVLFVDGLNPDVFEKVARQLQKSSHWDGINVHLASEIESDNQAKIIAESPGASFSVLVWERGCGLTAACGSGACVVGAAALASGFVERNTWIEVQMPGGRLFVRHTSRDASVQLTGSAQFVFQGQISV